jgi:ubiquinone/menaquinone biosynthesis C-methylase UbiE
MSAYYTGKRAQQYNARWRTYSEKTLAEALAMIDVPTLREVPARLGRAPRVLDVACGTGILLKELLTRLPGIEAYGVDVSEDMLAQARLALKDRPQVHVARVQVGTSETAGLPFAQETFDLITCTNVLHDILDAGATLSALRRLLVRGGQLVVEDFARRKPPFPWTMFEWLLRRIERNRVHAYTLREVESLCTQAGLQVASGKAFTIDWLWRGWALRASKASSEVAPANV